MLRMLPFFTPTLCLLASLLFTHTPALLVPARLAPRSSSIKVCDDAWVSDESGIKEIRHSWARWIAGAMMWMRRRQRRGLCGRGGRRMWGIKQEQANQGEQAVRYSGRA